MVASSRQSIYRWGDPKLIKAIVTDGAEIKVFPTSPRARSESSFKSTLRRRGRRDARRLHGPAGLSEHTAPPRCYILNVSVSGYQQLTFWGVELWQLFLTSREPAGTMRPEWGLRGKHEIMSFNPTPGRYLQTTLRQHQDEKVPRVGPKGQEADVHSTTDTAVLWNPSLSPTKFNVPTYSRVEDWKKYSGRTLNSNARNKI